MVVKRRFVRAPQVARCEGCPYRKGRTCGTDGDPKADLAIIGEAPGREELGAGKPFVGRSGKLLNAALEKAGVKREEAYLVNALSCQPTESPPSKEALNACQERMVEQVLAHPRKVILALGNSAARSLLNDHNFKITSKRGHPIDLGPEIGVVLPTFHPASILRNQGEYPRWSEDIKYAARILRGGTDAIKAPLKPTAYIMLLEPNEAAYYPGTDEWYEWDEDETDGSQLPDWPTRKVVTGIPAAVRAVNELLTKPELSVDIETGLSYSPRLGKVLCLSVSWTPTDAIVFSEGLIDSKAFRPHLIRLLTEPGPLWIGQNWKYDSSYLRHYLLEAEWPDTGALVSYHDTMLEHYTLDETKGTHDLESIARDLLGAVDYKWVVKRYTFKGDLGYENVPREILYQYCALDTSHTLDIHQTLCPKVHRSKSLTKLYESLLLPASRFLQKVQDYGLYVDQPFIDELDEELGKRLAAARKALGQSVEPLWNTDEYMASEWATKKVPEGYNSGNWRHNSFLLWKIFGYVPMNTNERTLRDLDQTGRDQSAIFGYKAKNYARGHPDRRVKLNQQYIQDLIDVRMNQRAYNVLVKGTRKHMEPDGRLHTTFNLQATETGRLSSTNPNLQNLPVPERDDPKPARNIVASPPGRVLLEADYSQIELRLLAHFSQDDFLLGVYRDGRDLHTEVSIAIWGDVVYDAAGKQIGGYTNYQRVRAKAVNFGIAYGRGAGSIAAEFDMPEEEAEEMRQAWFKRAPQAAAWLEELHQAPFTGRTVVTPFGRRRRFGVVSRENYHDLKNQSANFPMQSTATDLTLFSGIRAQAFWDEQGIDAHIVCLVHDAIVVETPEEIADAVSADLTRIMSDTPKRILASAIDFPVDTHIGRSWGTLKLEEMTTAKKVKVG